MKLRRPTNMEIRGGIILGFAALALIWLGTCLGGPVAVQTVNGPTHYDTVTAPAIAKQEPPAKPGVIHRIAHKPVQPERVQVAPGAGQELLAAVCDTAEGRRSEVEGRRSGLPGDTPRMTVIQGVNDNHSAPALVYAWEIRNRFAPGKVDMRLFTVGPEGQRIVDYKNLTLPVEGRLLPEPVVREARFPVKTIVTVGGITLIAGGIGYIAGKVF